MISRTTFCSAQPAMIRAARLDELAGGDHCYPPDDGDQVFLSARFDPEHAKPVLRIVEGHPLHCARQDFR